MIYKVKWGIYSDAFSGMSAILSSSPTPCLDYREKYRNFDTEEKAKDFEIKLKEAAKILQCDLNLRTSILTEEVE
jgi:hypothetical protein